MIDGSHYHFEAAKESQVYLEILRYEISWGRPEFLEDNKRTEEWFDQHAHTLSNDELLTLIHSAARAFSIEERHWHCIEADVVSLVKHDKKE